MAFAKVVLLQALIRKVQSSNLVSELGFSIFLVSLTFMVTGVGVLKKVPQGDESH